MAYVRSYETPYGTATSAGREMLSAHRQSFLITAWWLSVALTGLFIVIFGQDFLPAKFGYDAAYIRGLLDIRDLWNGFSFDGFINTARVWSLVFHVLPEAVVMPAGYCLLVVVAMRLLAVYEVPLVRYQLFAGGWLVCSSIFLLGISKEMIALPVALWFCLAGTRGSRFLATLAFLLYAAFFRQYWAICYFYFVFVLMALRLHIANRSRLAACILLLGFVLPFVAADVAGIEALTEVRMSVNIDRVDSPDARSAFSNPFENTGFGTDLANSVISWFYMNVPVVLLLDASPHYVFFAAFQMFSLGLFAAGCASFLRDAKRIQRSDAIHLRCAAFVIAYSLTQSIFEPDFGSFLRHEIVLMVPMLILAFYRAHVTRHF